MLRSMLFLIGMAGVVNTYGQSPDYPDNFQATTLSETSIELSWDPDLGGTTPTGFLIVARIVPGGTHHTVDDGTDVADDFDFSGPEFNGAVNVTYTGPSTHTYTFNGLSPETNYEFLIYPYNDSPVNYRTAPGTPEETIRTFSTVPATHATSFTATAASISQINLSFDAASTITDADGYIILRRTGSAPTSAGVTDGVEPGALSLPPGTTRITTITNPATTSYSNTGLSTSTTYYYLLIPYNYDGSNNSTYNYKTAPVIPVANATTNSDLLADAGPAATEVCDGDGIVLGGDPPATGGSGFYSISWTSSPPGFTSSASNPLVTPSTTTTYTLTVTDSDGNTDSDNIVVTVKERTDPDDLDIVFNPNQTSYSVESDPVSLSFTVSGGASGTGVFSGDGVNNTTNKFHPSAANIGSNSILLTFTNDDNCVTTRTEVVDVYDPNGFISGLDPLYCPEGDDDLTINIPAGYLSYVDVFLLNPSLVDIPTGTAWTKNNVTRQVHIELDQLPVGRNYFRIVYTRTAVIGYNYTPYFDLSCLCIQYTITPIYGPVPVNVYVPLIIKSPPATKIAFKAKEPEFCRNDSPIDLEGSPIGGIWQGAGVTPAVGNDNNPSFQPGDNGLATFNPGTAAIGANNIRYIFRDSDGCRDTSYVALTVFDVPTVNFTANDGCVGIPVEFGPSVTIPGGVTVDRYIWDFDDDSREVSATFNDPTYHTYTTDNDYEVSFGATTTDGCIVTDTENISIGSIPDVKLTWRNVCEGDPSRFGIKSNFFESDPPDVQTITWDFGDGTVLTDTNPVLSDSIKFRDYGATGYYEAFVTITSDLGCSNRDSAEVYKVPRTTPITATNEYLQDFNTATFEEQGWKTGGTYNSWEWGQPAATVINDDAGGGGNAWVTNLTGTYNPQERSWVHSPCFDLTAIERPVLSFDMRSLTRTQVDGAVLQINTTNTTNRESDWKTLGSIGEGENWFDATGIYSNPGNQSLLQTGWSFVKDSSEWRNAIIALDNVLAPLSPLERSRVRFRFAFATLSDGSTASDTEGFAFDNFKITQRDRVILLETFTNSGGTGGASDPNHAANNQINTFVSTRSGEIVKLEYHVSVSGPNADPLYLDNPVDANARAGYYGITSTPFALLDGKSGANLGNMFNKQTLKSARATIDAIITHDTPMETFNIEVQFTPKEDLPPNTVLHIAVIEKVINDAAAQGTNGETGFVNVMKKLLPNALGTRFPLGIAQHDTQTVSVSWTPSAYDLNNLAVIVFLQNEKTGEVYQSSILESPTYIPPASIITGVEPSLQDRIRVYPNPADDHLYISLPATINQELTIRLTDAMGKDIFAGSMAAGDLIKTIATGTLPGGAYLLQIEQRKGIMSRKKVIITH